MSTRTAGWRVGGRRRARGADEDTLLHPLSPEAEPFRMLRAGIRFSSVERPLRTLLIAAPRAQSGKSTVAANLALSFSQVGERVLLVDSDLRRPSLSRMFSIQARVGLSTFLLRGGDLSEHVIADIHDGLDLMPSGPLPPNPSELLASQRLVDGLARMAEGYDVVLFDAPPALANTDSVILASLVDGTLCVVDLARTRRREVQRTLELLDRAGARVIGTCVNRYGRAARGESYY